MGSFGRTTKGGNSKGGKHKGKQELHKTPQDDSRQCEHLPSQDMLRKDAGFWGRLDLAKGVSIVNHLLMVMKGGGNTVFMFLRPGTGEYHRAPPPPGCGQPWPSC